MKKTRGNFAVMARLVGLVRPLLGVMAGAVAMGVAGFLCAIFIPVLGGWALLLVGLWCFIRCPKEAPHVPEGNL